MMQSIFLTLFILAPTLSFANGKNWDGLNPPTSIILNGGHQEDSITPIKGNFQATTIGYYHPSFLSIKGKEGSTYTLRVDDANLTPSAATYYSNGFFIANGIKFALSNVHTLSLNASSNVIINQHALFSVIASGNTINTQGTEYGGASKIRFAEQSKLLLQHGANADFSQALFFIHDGLIELNKDSKLQIDASSIRIQRALQNFGGTLVLKGDVYHIGSPMGIATHPTQANSISKNGMIDIMGNFYNGGQAKTEQQGIFDVFDPAFGGGGNLLLYGGVMQVSGNIISKQGGDSILGGELLNPQDSSIQIYGGILRSKELQNQKGSHIIFGFYEGKMGQYQGNLKNQEGKIIIDLAGASQNHYQLVQGSTNVKKADLYLKNAHTEFVSATPLYDQNQHWDGSISFSFNKERIAALIHTLNPNEQSILKILGSSIFNTNQASTATLQADSKNLNSIFFNNFFAAPFNCSSRILSCRENR